MSMDQSDPGLQMSKPADPLGQTDLSNGPVAVNHVNGLDNHVKDVLKEKSSSSSDHKKEHKSSSSHKHGSSSSSHRHSSSGEHKHSSSKHHSSSSSRDKDRHHGSSSSSSKHHSSSSKDKSHSSSPHKSHGSGSSSSKHHSSSSSSKDPKSHSSSSHKSSGSSHHHSSSSSSKHKDGTSSSSSKHHHSSSSGSNDRHRSDKHHDKNRDKHKSSSGSSDKAKTPSNSTEKIAEVKSESASTPQVKPEPMSPVKVQPETLSPPKASPPLQVKSEPAAPNKVKSEPAVPNKVNNHAKAEDSDDDIPLSARLDRVKPETQRKRVVEDSDDDEPLAARAEKVKKVKKETPVAKPAGKKRKVEDTSFAEAPKKKKLKKPDPKPQLGSPVKGKKTKKEVEAETKWKWWEEEEQEEGVKWRYLEHKGPVFAPPYIPLPSNVKFFYNGKEMRLSQDTEEVAGFYGKMLDHDYTTKEVFNKNFFKDWRKVMTKEERETITDLTKCDFRQMHAHFTAESEARKNRTKEEKKQLKEDNEQIVEEYGFCVIDKHKQKIGNFRIEPPGLFRGRGEHPKQGMLKQRIMPQDVIINCSKNAPIPKAPDGQRWKEVRHDNTVTWLASWNENIQGSTKYVMLNAASKLKGEKDWKKYETARGLHKCVDKIRATYHEDWKSKEMRIRQRSVALYFIDKLALRAGNEKDEDQADTVGCCSLRVEHIKLHEEMDGKEFVVEFDFLGKDSIRYYNTVAVEKRVFRNLQLFTENKQDGDDLFDRLNTAIMNKHLQTLMDGLTAKVFRTYNASKTLQEQLDLLTNPNDAQPAKLLSYNRANRAVAILCNHQRAAPKNFGKQMENLQSKIDAKRDAVREAKRELKQSKSDHKAMKTEKTRKLVERKKAAVDRTELQLTKLEVQATDKDENKEIALGTSKLNYLDPRISVAWCKKWDVPVEKIYNKTQRDKFAWALDMAEEDFRF